MDGIEAMTRGWWRPSPGSIYPLLERMAAEGTVKKRDDGRYELTPKANAELEISFGAMSHSPRTSGAALAEMQNMVSLLEDMASTNPDEIRTQKEKLKALAKRLEELGS